MAGSAGSVSPGLEAFVTATERHDFLLTRACACWQASSQTPCSSLRSPWSATWAAATTASRPTLTRAAVRPRHASREVMLPGTDKCWPHTGAGHSLQDAHGGCILPAWWCPCHVHPASCVAPCLPELCQLVWCLALVRPGLSVCHQCCLRAGAAACGWQQQQQHADPGPAAQTAWAGSWPWTTPGRAAHSAGCRASQSRSCTRPQRADLDASTQTAGPRSWTPRAGRMELKDLCNAVCRGNRIVQGQAQCKQQRADSATVAAQTAGARSWTLGSPKAGAACSRTSGTRWGTTDRPRQCVELRGLSLRSRRLVLWPHDGLSSWLPMLGSAGVD